MVSAAYLETRKEIAARFDRKKPSKDFKCTPGKSIPCKGRCISANFTCRDEVRVTTQERSQLEELISSNTDKYSGRTIRDLQQEARERGVYRANHQSKQQLIETLKTLDKTPDSQEKLRRTLENRRKTRQAITGASPELAKTWKSIQTVSRAYRQNPDQGGLIIAAGLLGVTTALGGRMRDRYKSGLTDSANLAMQRAQNVSIERTNKDNIMLAVGGFGSLGSRGQDIKDQLESPLNNNAGEKWFKKGNHIIPINYEGFDIDAPNVSKRDSQGNYNPIYLGSVAQKGFGKFLTNLQRGRNDSAVDLASQIYAYGNRYPKKKLNILAHGVGGNVVDEATEILARMPKNRGRGVNGRQIIKDNLNIVRLGSPSFGFTNDKEWKREINHRTITSKSDPFSILPKKAAQWIDSVKGAEIGDYLGDPEVRSRIRETFGYYSSSLSGAPIADKKRKEKRQIIANALNAVAPGTGKFYTQLGKIQDKARENPALAGGLAFALVTSSGAAAYRRSQKNYQTGLSNAASAALTEVENTRISNPHNRKNITIAVGGTGEPAREIIENLPESIKGNSRGVGGTTHVINAEEFGVNSANVPDFIEPESKQYYAYLAANGYGGQLQKIATNQGIDPEAIKLAALLYGHGQANFKKNRKDYSLNVMAAGDGAIKGRAAMEILNRMGPRGKAIAKNVKLASLGSPGFGLTNEDPGSVTNSKYVAPEVNYMGDGDFFNLFPGRKSATTIKPQGVKHGIKNYLENPEVQRSLLENFYR